MQEPALTFNAHPFQKFHLQKNPLWAGCTFFKGNESFFENRSRELTASFHEAVEAGTLFKFCLKYTRLSKEMIREAPDLPLLKPLFRDALIRLVFRYFFLRDRSRPSLIEKTSVKTYRVPRDILSQAMAQSDRMERENIKVEDYDLKSDRPLWDWIVRHIRPELQGYVRTAALRPEAHIRYIDAEKHGDTWSHIYERHPFAYFHLDEWCYSLPFIIYLSEVSEESGPFSIIETSDKIPQNPILRAFHQSLCHTLGIHCDSPEDRQTIASLPAVFQGGDLNGTFTGPEVFSSFKATPCTGSIGSAILFEGFQLIHAGGHPRRGHRKAMFVNFQYPMARVYYLLGKTAAVFWRLGQLI